ncbi:MAG: threonine/serine dehydratase [Chloroflexaceae bacterium]|nr:threonine/serine dehydratase [Chloroflexaceae bacterium]
MHPTTQQIDDTTRRIRPYVRETPLDYSPYLSQLVGAEVYLKLENMQHTGSFKVRGALNKLLALSAAARAAGVVAASSGNHGAAVAYGATALGCSATIFVPTHASPAKVANMAGYGAEVRHVGEDSLESELFARRYAEERGLAYLSPYNDMDVVTGQGTLGAELRAQLPNLDTVLVTVGGGGLAAGVASYLKAGARPVRLIGCQPAASAVMAESVRAGHIVELPSLSTLSDGSAGGIEPDAITFSMCRDLLDDYLLVSEEAIAAAIRLSLDKLHMLIEGAAGVALAALLQQQEALRGQRVVVILCGANISLAALRGVLAE